MFGVKDEEINGAVGVDFVHVGGERTVGSQENLVVQRT
jgi:hypothetical protein